MVVRSFSLCSLMDLVEVSNSLEKLCPVRLALSMASFKAGSFSICSLRDLESPSRKFFQNDMFLEWTGSPAGPTKALLASIVIIVNKRERERERERERRGRREKNPRECGALSTTRKDHQTLARTCFFCVCLPFFFLNKSSGEKVSLSKKATRNKIGVSSKSSDENPNTKKGFLARQPPARHPVPRDLANHRRERPSNR